MASSTYSVDTDSVEAYKALEKENRILKKKLELSECDRQVLETNVERSETLLRKIITDLEQSKQALEQRGQALETALQQLQTTQGHLVQSEKMSALGTLVAGVAHEINNPVSFVHGNLSHARSYVTDLLSIIHAYQQAYPVPAESVQYCLDEADLEFLEQDLGKLLTSMQVGTERIREIVRSLRTFSRLDEAEFKAAHIHDGIEGTVMILQHRLKACGDLPEIAVVQDFGPLPLVECYPGRLNQVFMNLLSNAIDAVQERYRETPDRTFMPCITIQTRLHTGDRQDTAVICITDNGIGIPDQVRPHLFDPFFTTKAVGKGTGLGLSISYQIVTEQHHGTLVCESLPQGGTAFVVTIPCQQHANTAAT